MSEKKEYREFRLEVGACSTSAFSWDEDNPNQIKMNESIHVIEHSALLELQAENKDLKIKCEMLLGLLDDGDDFIKPQLKYDSLKEKADKLRDELSRIYLAKETLEEIETAIAEYDEALK